MMVAMKGWLKHGLSGLLLGLAVLVLVPVLWLGVGFGGAAAHNIPSRVTVYGFVKAEVGQQQGQQQQQEEQMQQGARLVLLLRVPMEVFGEIPFPLRGPGYLRFAEAEAALREAARVYITESVFFYEDGVELTEKTLEAVRVSLPGNRSFAAYDTALANVLSPPLDDSTDLFWRQGVLDMLVTYPIQSASSDFAVEPRLGLLADETTIVLRFLPFAGDGDNSQSDSPRSDSGGTGGDSTGNSPDTDDSARSNESDERTASTDTRTERVFTLSGEPGVVQLDPRWHQAALRFVGMGFEHILGGYDHLLFLFCLIIPLRSLRHLIAVITAFTVAHSITLMAAAFGVVPGALWFPPLIETLIALSIVYMAFENILGPRLKNRWLVTFGFGLIHGFGFSFLFSETLQFAGSHLLTSLLAFNIGVELGQLLVLALTLPLLAGLFHIADRRLAGILLSALIAHSAWHWMTDRATTLAEYNFQMPIVDNLFWAAATGWLMLLIIIALALWAMSEVLRRFGMDEK